MTALDVRQPAQPAAALAIRPGQIMWDDYQMAALDQLGLKDASNADRAVFLHQCQRTGLDPFSRQIYMIGRQEKQRDGTWRTKWTIQTGIDGFRVNRDRAERLAGVRGTLGRAVWYDHEGNEFKVWVRREPPAACEITYTVYNAAGRGTPYTSVLMFAEYVQTKDGKAIAQWATKPAHMLEKCTEADLYRKAFPQDFAGVILDDAMPPADDAAAAQNGRVTAADIRGRTRPQAHAEIVTGTTDPSPADSRLATPPADDETAGEAPDRPAQASSGQRGIIHKHFERLGYSPDSPDDRQARLRATAKLAGRELGLESSSQLDQEQAARVIRWLEKCADGAALELMLADGEVSDG